MNKKLFTLAAALMMGSAFTVNAQSPAASGLSAGDEISGSTYYFLGDGTGNFLGGSKVTPTAGGSYTVIDATAATATNNKNALWKVIPSVDNGVSYIELVNLGTEAKLAFNADGSAVTASQTTAPAVTKMAIDGQWGDADNDGVLELPAALKIRVSGLTSTEQWLSYSTGWNLTGANAAAAQAITVSPIAASVPKTTEELNKLLGNGFTFNFPAADPAPADNVFAQKLTAVEIPNTTVVGAYADVSDAKGQVGTYFVVSAPEDAIVEISGKFYFVDEPNFKASTVVALAPVANYGINGLAQGGHKFTTVLAEELVQTAAKAKTSYENAHFTVVEPDAVNKKGTYLISLNPNTAADNSTVPASAGTQYVMAVTSAGVTYVTTNSNTTEASNIVYDAKVSGSNVLAAADLLKTDGPAVFNIQFVSGYDKLTTVAGSEYGKYLRVTPNSALNAWELIAQGSDYVNLDAPESQWIVTGYADGIFTFTDREARKSLAIELRKTDTEGVYDAYIAAGQVFNYAFIDNNGQYDATNTKNFNSGEIQVKLVPATMTANGGFADLTEEELANPVQIKFNVGNALFSQAMYLKVNTAGSGVELTSDEDKADYWDVIKLAAKQDSISSKVTYTYLKDKKPTQSDAVANIGITTYILKLNGKDVFFNGAGTLINSKKQSAAPRQIIKVMNDGSLYMFPASVTTSNAFADNVKVNTKAYAIDNTTAVFGASQSIYDNAQVKSLMEFESMELLSSSLEAQPRHASFHAVNGGILGMDENNDAIIAATKDEAQALTFWLDTTDVNVKDASASFYISQAVASEPEAETKAAAVEPRMFLFNATDSTTYYNEGTASTTVDNNYYLSDKVTTKAIFKAATLINKDSVNTVIKGKEVGLNKDNGLNRFKFQILEVEEDEYVLMNGSKYLVNLNGKVGLDADYKKALVVTLGEGDATANEVIAAESGVQVIGGQGVVTVQGAAGKVITVANILGQTIANQVAASDNVTIAAPAGIAVVSVDGEATKVVVK